MYLQAGISAVGLFGVVPVLSSGAGRLWRRHEDPLLSFTKRHHGSAQKVSVCGISVFFRQELIVVIMFFLLQMCEEFKMFVSAMFIFGH